MPHEIQYNTDMYMYVPWSSRIAPPIGGTIRDLEAETACFAIVLKTLTEISSLSQEQMSSWRGQAKMHPFISILKGLYNNIQCSPQHNMPFPYAFNFGWGEHW